MKFWISLLILTFFNSVFSQQYSNELLWSDDFTNSRFLWKNYESNYSSDVINGRLYCQMPRGGEWNWTYIGIPDQMSSSFNSSEDEVSLLMDYYYTRKSNGNHFGFIFDLHNVSDYCEGGDGYSLIFNIDHIKKTLTPAFFSTKDCNSRTLNYTTGKSVNILANNHIEIKKLGSTWQIFLNSDLCLILKINGFISIDRLKFGTGNYTFDDFNMISRQLIIDKKEYVGNKSNLPTIYALCVGINNYSKYEGTGIPGLRSAVSDAKHYSDFLKTFSGGLVPKDQVVLLTDLNATRQHILTQIQSLFGRAREDDLVVLFISGHGGPNSFFCASDGPLKYRDLNEMIETSTNAGRKLILADACYSGNFATVKNTVGSRGINYSPEEVLNIFYSELQKSNKNITYLLAARPDELSWENLKDEYGKQISGGTFTHYLVKGLNCEAKDANEDLPIIYVRDIFRYLEEKISHIHEGQYYSENGQLRPVIAQHPVINGNANPDMPISPCMKQ